MPPSPPTKEVTIDANTPGAKWVPGGRGSTGYWEGPTAQEQSVIDNNAAYGSGPPSPGMIFTGASYNPMSGKSTVGHWQYPSTDRGGGFFSDLVSSISNAVSSVGSAVENAVKSVGNTLDAIAKNPLPAIETLILTLNGVPPELASAAVTAINGGDVTQIATSALTSYVGSQVTSYVSDEFASSNNPNYSNEGGAAGNVASNTPSTISPAVVKAASSAVGADAGATAATLIKTGNLETALNEGTKAAVTSLARSAGAAAGSEVASNIEDPTLAKIAGAATKGGTTAALTGQDIVSGATEAARGDVLNAAGDVISKNLPDVSGAGNIDLSGVKEAIKPISDVATQVLQPLEQPIKDVAQAGSDAATRVLQPLEKPIKDVAQAGSDIATKVLQPLEKPIKDVIQKTSDVLTDATKPLGDAITSAASNVKDELPNVNVKIPIDNLDKSIINLMGQAPTESTLGTPAVSNVAYGGESAAPSGSGSAAAYGGADVAMLGDTSQAGMGSKVSKKGGKYPWGEPEGTTALKEGLGI